MNKKIYASRYLCVVCIRNITSVFHLVSSNDVTHSEMKMKNDMDFCALNIQNSALFSLIIQMRE